MLSLEESKKILNSGEKKYTDEEVKQHLGHLAQMQIETEKWREQRRKESSMGWADIQNKFCDYCAQMPLPNNDWAVEVVHKASIVFEETHNQNKDLTYCRLGKYYYLQTRSKRDYNLYQKWCLVKDVVSCTFSFNESDYTEALSIIATINNKYNRDVVVLIPPLLALKKWEPFKKHHLSFFLNELDKLGIPHCDSLKDRLLVFGGKYVIAFSTASSKHQTDSIFRDFIYLNQHNLKGFLSISLLYGEKHSLLKDVYPTETPSYDSSKIIREVAKQNNIDFTETGNTPNKEKTIIPTKQVIEATITENVAIPKTAIPPHADKPTRQEDNSIPQEREITEPPIEESQKKDNNTFPQIGEKQIETQPQTSKEPVMEKNNSSLPKTDIVQQQKDRALITPQMVYSPTDIHSVIKESIQTTQTVLIVEGIYHRKGAMEYNGYWYDEIKAQYSKHTLTALVPTSLRTKMNNGELMQLSGVIEKKLSDDGKISIQLRVSNLVGKKEKGLDENELRQIELQQKKAALGYRNVDNIIETILYEGQRKPRISLLYAETSITDQDFKAGIQASMGAIDFISDGTAFTRIPVFIQKLATLDNSGYDVICLVRGGGTGINEVFDNPDLTDAVINMRTPVITAIGHAVDNPLVCKVSDKNIGTPSLLGQYFKDTVERIAVEKSHSKSVLVDQVKKQYSDQIKSQSEQINNLQKQIADQTKGHLDQQAKDTKEIERLRNRIDVLSKNEEEKRSKLVKAVVWLSIVLVGLLVLSVWLLTEL